MNISQIKKDFPVFGIHPRLVYLDSAATSLKPKEVISALTEYYTEYPANIHRGIYHLSEKATEEYEETRKIVSLFLGASSGEEIIFTKNTTEAINLLASCLSRGGKWGAGDEIVTTITEHHANFIPWQQVAKEKGMRFRAIGITSDGRLDIYARDKTDIHLSSYVNKHTKVFSCTYVSNVLGIINPIRQIIKEVKRINPQTIIVIDAAQAAPHIKINVQELGADFVAFSGHKMLGPTGVGILWGKKNLLNAMPPYQTGGGMIRQVTLESTEFDIAPARFEAGTPDIASVIALKSAIQYLEYVGMDTILEHEQTLLAFLIADLQKEFGEQIHLYGDMPVNERVGVLSFTLNGVHPHDISQILDEDVIAVRAGHHCAQPLHTVLNAVSTTRASLYLYNDEDDVKRLVQGLRKAVSLFSI